MNGENFNIYGRQKRILVSPLEWGLGHATRCIPIIKALLEQGCEVLIAAETDSAELLKKEFPALQFLYLKGYRIKYSRNKIWLPFKILFQFPKIIRSINNENSWLKAAVKAHNIDAVISDNRFGLYHTEVPCVYITHQLMIETGNRFTRWVAQKIHYHYINKYTVCWVPDADGEINLAGKLSHPEKLPRVAVKYTGPLSRFEKITAPKKYDLLICLSGPEPQRTIFEDILLNDLQHYSGKALFVRGLPLNKKEKKIQNKNVAIANHLSALDLNKAIEGADMFIGRCGYTTVMDLVKLQHKAVLIPTPGQKEQEYLAGFLLQQQLFCCIKQNNFSLEAALVKAGDFPFTSIAINQNIYQKIIKDFVDAIKIG